MQDPEHVRTKIMAGKYASEIPTKRDDRNPVWVKIVVHHNLTIVEVAKFQDMFYGGDKEAPVGYTTYSDSEGTESSGGGSERSGTTTKFDAAQKRAYKLFCTKSWFVENKRRTMSDNLIAQHTGVGEEIHQRNFSARQKEVLMAILDELENTEECRTKALKKVKEKLVQWDEAKKVRQAKKRRKNA